MEVKGSVLIVDRDSSLVDILSSYLACQGYKVLYTNRVREAVKKIEKQRFAHIFVDPVLEPDNEKQLFAELVRVGSLNAKTPLTIMCKELEFQVVMPVVKRLHAVLRKPFMLGEFAFCLNKTPGKS